MWITSLCLLVSVGYRGQHDLNTQVANTQHFGWVFATWVFTTLGIVEVGYSVLLPNWGKFRKFRVISDKNWAKFRQLG